MVRALSSHDALWLGFDSQSWSHLWVDFFGSLLCFERFFSARYSGFPVSSKRYLWFDFTLFQLTVSPISASAQGDLTLTYIKFLSFGQKLQRYSHWSYPVCGGSSSNSLNGSNAWNFSFLIFSQGLIDFGKVEIKKEHRTIWSAIWSQNRDFLSWLYVSYVSPYIFKSDH